MTTTSRASSEASDSSAQESAADEAKEQDFATRWDTLRQELEKQFSCSLELRRVSSAIGPKPYFSLTGQFTGSKLSLIRLKLRDTFPWQLIQARCQTFLNNEFGEGEYFLYLNTLDPHTEPKTR